MEYARKIILLKKLLEELKVDETFAILHDLTNTVNNFNEARE